MVTNTEDDDDSQEETVNYKLQYKNLKRKLKFLIYENECFQQTLRSTQRRLLKASRDRSFLLDRLFALEKVEASSSEGEETESSDDGEILRSDAKRRKMDFGSNSYGTSLSSGSSSKSSVKKKKPSTPKAAKPQQSSSQSSQQIQAISSSGIGDSHTIFIKEEIDRTIEARHHYLDLESSKPTTLHSEIFSNEPSLDSESNEICDMEPSPSTLTDDCLNVDMMHE
ncbi:INO80 complex subunit E [Nilaparvata lugens]|uniref:INO80 complex subunit E n=1 Tax=Nilaparvata lugens TaxID=108931 RepID=UPI000B98F38C|nr:INO80 complex subunit E [Nilaparvata lugens]